MEIALISTSKEEKFTRCPREVQGQDLRLNNYPPPPPPFRPPFRLPEARWISTLAALHLKNAESHAKKPVGIFDIQSIFEGSETTLTLLVLLLTPLLLSSLNLQIPEEKKARI